MTQQNIMYFIQINNGMLTNQQAVANGISRGMIKYLVKQGKLQRAARGVYTLPEVLEDEFLNLQTRFKRGIFSHETALFLCNLTDRTPSQYRMTFPEHYNLSNPRIEGIRCAQVKLAFYSLGFENIKSPAGNILRCYSAERTLCDILRPHQAADIQIISEAFKNYIYSQKKDIPKLSEYAKILGVEKKIRAYLEVLL